jgi:hypothetical protein
MNILVNTTNEDWLLFHEKFHYEYITSVATGMLEPQSRAVSSIQEEVKKITYFADGAVIDSRADPALVKR